MVAAPYLAFLSDYHTQRSLLTCDEYMAWMKNKPLLFDATKILELFVTIA